MNCSILESAECSVEECGNARKGGSRGLCHAHYQAALRGTLPMPERAPVKTLKDKLETNVMVEPFSGCWLWTGPLTHQGYGRVWHGKNRWFFAHRVSFQLHKGDIPEGLLVLHSCDTRSCINPAHLRTGTDQDNKDDAIQRNRHARGERMNTAKVTASDVLEMREEANAGISFAELSRRYGINPSSVRAAVIGVTWKDLTCPRHGHLVRSTDKR